MSELATSDALALCDELRAAIVRTGWSEAARRSGVNRCNLHRAFPANRGMDRLPTFATIARVAAAVGMRPVLVRRGFNG